MKTPIVGCVHAVAAGMNHSYARVKSYVRAISRTSSNYISFIMYVRLFSRHGPFALTLQRRHFQSKTIVTQWITHGVPGKSVSLEILSTVLEINVCWRRMIRKRALSVACTQFAVKGGGQRCGAQDEPTSNLIVEGALLKCCQVYKVCYLVCPCVRLNKCFLLYSSNETLICVRKVSQNTYF